jgi:hypothetical protein
MFIEIMLICKLYVFIPTMLQLGCNFVWEMQSIFNIKFHVGKWLSAHEI